MLSLSPSHDTADNKELTGYTGPVRGAVLDKCPGLAALDRRARDRQPIRRSPKTSSHLESILSLYRPDSAFRAQSSWAPGCCARRYSAGPLAGASDRGTLRGRIRHNGAAAAWVQDSGSIIYRPRELAEIDRNVCGSWQLDLQHRTFAAGGTRSQRCQTQP